MEALGETRARLCASLIAMGGVAASDTFSHVTGSLSSHPCRLSSVHPCSSSSGILHADELPHLIPVELDALPPPSVTPTPGRRSTNDTLHSLLSKTLFSLCFSESCTLFLLLM